MGDAGLAKKWILRPSVASTRTMATIRDKSATRVLQGLLPSVPLTLIPSSGALSQTPFFERKKTVIHLRGLAPSKVSQYPSQNHNLKTSLFLSFERSPKTFWSAEPVGEFCLPIMPLPIISFSELWGVRCLGYQFRRIDEINNNKKSKPATRPYQPNLFDLSLQVKKSRDQSAKSSR